MTQYSTLHLDYIIFAIYLHPYRNDWLPPVNSSVPPDLPMH